MSLQNNRQLLQVWLAKYLNQSGENSRAWLLKTVVVPSVCVCVSRRRG